MAPCSTWSWGEQVVVADGVLATGDSGGIAAEAQQLAGRLWQRMADL